MVIRYPGSKSRCVATIAGMVARYCESVGWGVEYREPFFGAGSVGFHIMEEYPQLRSVWINDRDPAVACIWERVLRSPEELIQKLRSFDPDVEQFFNFRSGLRQVDGMGLASDRLGVAFRKIAIHQMSRNGLGTRSGGPIGGRDQCSDYKIDSRYSIRSMTKNIVRASGLLGRVRTHPDGCSCLDFEQVIRAPGRCIIYLDPPYVEQGPALYQFSFTEEDHQRLAWVLKRESRPWLLSYDVHPMIRSLYEDLAIIEEINVPYSMGKCRYKTEYLIRSRSLAGIPVPESGFGRGSEDVLRN